MMNSLFSCEVGSRETLNACTVTEHSSYLGVP